MSDLKNHGIANRLIDTGRGIVGDFQDEIMRCHDEAMAVVSLEDVIEVLTGVAELLGSELTKIADRFFKNDPSIPDYNGRRRLIECTSSLASLIKEKLLTDAKKFADEGYEVNGVDAMTAALAKLDGSIAAVRKTCPEPNKDMLAKTAENIRRGQYKAAKEILDEARDDRS
jgi:hypothetical protein